VKYPRSSRGYTLLGAILTSKGDTAKANEAFQKARSLAADNSERVEVQDTINSLAAGEQ
jgi:cytochrome c-type biogenesis protein CcmH/NrfG